MICSGRSTNRTMSVLYDRYYSLVDLKYPGPQGYVLRTVHNPFGDGNGVVIVGGSDTAGVNEGAAALVDVLSKRPAAEGNLSLGWTMETRLGRGRVFVFSDFYTFTTEVMGHTGITPNARQRAISELEYWMLRELLDMPQP